MPIELRPTGDPTMTRRQVLATGAAAGLAGTVPGCASKGQAPGPEYDPNHERVLLLADTHINADASTVSKRGGNMSERLDSVLTKVIEQETQYSGVQYRKKHVIPSYGTGWEGRTRFKFAVINGDAAHLDGQTGDYKNLIERLAPLLGNSRESGYGTPIHITLGNHDDRNKFRHVVAEAASELTDKHVRKLGKADGSQFADWFLLDSLREVNETPGTLGDEQLAWLDRALCENTSECLPGPPALIVVHHPPVPDDNPDKPFSLLDHEAFWAVVDKHPRVRAIFHGHTHLWNPRPAGWTMKMSDGTERPMRVPLIGLPPTSYVFREDAPWGYVVADLDRDGMTLTLRAMDNHAKDGEQVRIDWA